MCIRDRVGTVAVIVFPKDYERNAELISEDAKVFIEGRVSVEEEKASKLILERIYPFDDTRRELWIQFPDRQAYEPVSYTPLAVYKRQDHWRQI